MVKSDFVADSPPFKLVCRGDSDWDSDIVTDPESHPHRNPTSNSTADLEDTDLEDSDDSDDSDFVDVWASGVDVLVTDAGTGAE